MGLVARPRTRHFGELLQAASGLKYPHRVKEIHGNAIDYESFDVIHDFLPYLDLKDLKLLSLEFWFEHSF